MKAYSFILILLVLLSGAHISYGQKDESFYFYFQGIFTKTVTLNTVNQLFGDFSKISDSSVTFSSGTTLKHISNAIEKDHLHLLLWGYSDPLNDLMTSKGYEHFAFNPLKINIYQYVDGPAKHSKPPRIAVLADSTAHFTAKHYFQAQNKDVEFVIFNDYFDLIQASFRKEVDQIIAVHTFSIAQPGSVQKRFNIVETLPSLARVSVWLKADIGTDRKDKIYQYLKSKEELMSSLVGTTEFTRPSH